MNVKILTTFNCQKTRQSAIRKETVRLTIYQVSRMSQREMVNGVFVIRICVLSLIIFKVVFLGETELLLGRMGHVARAPITPQSLNNIVTIYPGNPLYKRLLMT